MAFTLKAYQEFEATLADGETLRVGDRTVPKSITLTTGGVYRITKLLADAYGHDTLWETGDGGMDTFEVALIYSDADVVVQFRNEQATDEFALFSFQGGVWHILTSDDFGAVQTTGRLDGADLEDNTDYGQVDQIVVQRDVADDAGDANVSIILLN